MELTVQQKQYLIQKLYKESSLYDFLRELGYNDLNLVHKDLCSFLEASIKCKIVLMPRYSFKSSICTIGNSLFKLNRNQDLRILIYSDANTKAEGFLSSIKDHIEGKVAGSRFSMAYDWTPKNKSTSWNQSMIEIDRNTAFPEPSVDTAGIETSLIGKHYDIIIFDDIVSDKNTTTKEQMDKVADCYRRSLSLLKPGGEVLIIGTRWHFGDLYGRLIAENKLNKVFDIFIIDGEDDPKYGKFCFSDIGLTQEFLSHQKTQQGSYNYSCLYRNSPTDEETAIFKMTDFAFYDDINYADLYITATVDPAGQGEDFTGITVVGTDNEMNMYVLDAVNRHLQPSEIVEELVRLQYKYNYGILGVETNFYRGMLEHEIRRRRDNEHTLNPKKFKLFGISEFTASSRESKFNRIRGLQPYHERKSLRFPGKSFELLTGSYSELAWQMLQFPNSAHDDLLDSLSQHLPLIRKGGMAKKAEPKVNTPAWLELQAYRKEVEFNARLPRRLRRTPIGLAFN
jgi:hypothetical protein